MIDQTSPVDRPPPGHYQGRLSTVLAELPAAGGREWARWQPLATPRRVLIRSRRRRTGQLALPLEAFRG